LSHHIEYFSRAGNFCDLLFKNLAVCIFLRWASFFFFILGNFSFCSWMFLRFSKNSRNTVGHDIFARIIFLRIANFELFAHLIFAYSHLFLYYPLLLFYSGASYFRDLLWNREIRENKMRENIVSYSTRKLPACVKYPEISYLSGN